MQEKANKHALIKTPCCWFHTNRRVVRVPRQGLRKKSEKRRCQQGETQAHQREWWFQKASTTIKIHDVHLVEQDTRACILEEAFNTKILALPRPLGSHNQANHSKQCRYHQNYCHYTKECIVLKNKIKELIQKGCLNDFVSGNNYNRERYRAKGNGGCRDGYRGGYAGNRFNYQQHPTGEGKQQQKETP